MNPRLILAAAAAALGLAACQQPVDPGLAGAAGGAAVGAAAGQVIGGDSRSTVIGAGLGGIGGGLVATEVQRQRQEQLRQEQLRQDQLRQEQLQRQGLAAPARQVIIR